MIHWSGWAAAALATAALAGCSRAPSTTVAGPPAYLEVTGQGESVRELPAAGSVEIGPMTASGQGTVTGPAPDETLAARAGARRAALRELAARVQAAPMGVGTTIGEHLAGAPAAAQELERLLEEQAVVAWRDGTTSGSEGRSPTTAVATLPPSALAGWLSAQRGSGDGLSGTTEEMLNRQAYEAALAEAKEKLRETLMAVEVRDGERFGDLAAEDETLARELDALLFVTPADEINYPRVGACEVKFFFDRNLLKGIVERQRSAWWAPWR